VKHARWGFSGVGPRHGALSWAWALVLLVLLGCPRVGSATEEAPAEEGAVVRLAEVNIVTLYDLPGLASAKERARTSAQGLERALHEVSASDIKLEFQAEPFDEHVGRIARIYAGETLLLRLAELDATQAGRSDFRAYAVGVQNKLRDVFKREHQRSAIAERVLAASTVVFLGLMGLLLLRAVRSLARRARHRVHQGEQVAAMRVGTVELLPAGAVREGVRVALVVGSWFVHLVVLYAWVVMSLSLFESTRRVAERATGTLFAPVWALLGRLAGEVPVLVALVFALLILALVMRFIGAYFSAIERGEVEVDWVRPEAARITGHLLSIAVTIAAFLFVAPLLTGSDRGVFSRIGELGLAILALSTTPILASSALGVRLVYMHAFRKGDQISYGGHVGRVQRVGLFDLVLHGENDVIIVVPHVFSLWHATQIFPRRPSVKTTAVDARAAGAQGETDPS
jgi:hypothetical protein